MLGEGVPRQPVEGGQELHCGVRVAREVKDFSSRILCRNERVQG